MGIQPKMFAKGRIVHILVHKGKAGIGVAKGCLPILMSKTFAVESQNDTPGMVRDQVGNIRIVQEDGTIELAHIQRILFWSIPVLGKSNA